MRVSQFVNPLITATIIGGFLFSTAVPAQAQEVADVVEQTAAAEAVYQRLSASTATADTTDQELVRAAVENPLPTVSADDDRDTSGASENSQVAAVTGSAPRATVVGASITDTALQYLGVPYVSGGGTPAGFDCSGFTSFVYGLHGISLAHSSAAQRAAGTVVSAADAQPGDIVWWPGHVAIYLGNGKVVHALQPGSTVVVGTAGNLRGSAPTFLRF